MSSPTPVEPQKQELGNSPIVENPEEVLITPERDDYEYCCYWNGTKYSLGATVCDRAKEYVCGFEPGTRINRWISTGRTC